MNPIVFAMRRPFTVMVLVVAVALGSVLAVTRMPIDIFPNLNLPVVYVCPALRRHGPGPDGGAAHQLLRVPLPLHHRHPPRREPQHPGHGPDEALLPPRHQHGPGDGRDDRLRHPVAGLHAAGDGLAVHHPVRRRQRPGGLPGALERDQVDRRDPGPGAVQGPADVRQPAGRLGAAPVRRQPADGRRPGRSRPAPVVLACRPTR